MAECYIIFMPFYRDLIRTLDYFIGSYVQTFQKNERFDNIKTLIFFKILERIRDTITKFTSACAKHDNFLERVQKIENRGVNALLDEMMMSSE